MKHALRAAGAMLSILLAACGDSVAVDGAPAPVDGFLGEPGDGRVRLSWSDAAGAEILVVRFGPDGVRGAPETGRTVRPGDPVGDGVAVYYGPAEGAEDVPPCTEQVYAAWARDEAGRWSATPATVRVERERDRAPGGPNAGRLVAETPGPDTTDAFAELSPDVTLHYAAYACTPCAECEPAGAHAQVTPTLMEALRGGGFVVFWRHGTDRVCQDQPYLGFATQTDYPDWWARCDRNCPSDGTGTATARQLSPEGYAQAEEIGRALKERGIPFDRTISSEFCRCFETAETMALAPVETAPEVTNYVYLDLFPDRCAAARLVMQQPPAPGTNRAIVSHPFNECAAGPGPDLALPLPGQASVFRYEGAGEFRFVAKVGWNEWATLP